MVFPVTIGAGLRVFPETLKRSPWTLTGTRAVPVGNAGRHVRPSSAAG